MVTAGLLLRMPSDELQLRVEEESAVNPALEIVRESPCPACGSELSNGHCWHCHTSAEELRLRLDEYSYPLGRLRFPAPIDDDQYDPMENTALPLSLQEYLLQQARLLFDGRELPIAEHLISELNEDGLLETDCPEAAGLLGVPVAAAESVLSRLQTLDPPGVFARSVQECVLIQIRELAGQSPVPPLVEPVISRHWQDLANHAYAKIERALDARPGEVEAAVDFIHRNLHPYPGRLYHSPYPGPASPAPAPVRPDVIIQRDFADYLIEVVRPFDFELRVSVAYQRLAAEAHNGKSGSPEYRLALEHCRRANWLVQCLALREQTLREIAEYVAAYQRSYLDTGSEQKMRPLTRTQVAGRIGKHPSTVSRAVAGKFVALPDGDLLPFERFFAPAVAPKTIIAELLSNEDPGAPLTDEQICRILRMRGFRMARRTVAKYRLALRLPSSNQRGRH